METFWNQFTIEWQVLLVWWAISWLAVGYLTAIAHKPTPPGLGRFVVTLVSISGQLYLLFAGGPDSATWQMWTLTILYLLAFVALVYNIYTETANTYTPGVYFFTTVVALLEVWALASSV
jgi:hypothetical protein